VYQLVNVGDLERVGASDIGPTELRMARLIARPNEPVKVLGDGELARKLTVRAHAFSATAKKKIEDAGGSAEVIDASSSHGGST
jgi:large subunit ribosomal protein L15